MGEHQGLVEEGLALITARQVCVDDGVVETGRFAVDTRRQRCLNFLVAKHALTPHPNSHDRCRTR